MIFSNRCTVYSPSQPNHTTTPVLHHILLNTPKRKCDYVPVNARCQNTNLNPSTMNLARIITDSYQFISQEVASELYTKFDTQTVKTIAWIDHDTRLALLVLTIISLKHGLFTAVTWEYIYSIEDIIVSWPNLPVSRK